MSPIAMSLGFNKSPDFAKLRFCNVAKSGEQRAPERANSFGSRQTRLGEH